MKPQADATVRALRSMSEIARAELGACANPGRGAPDVTAAASARLARPLGGDLGADCKDAVTVQTEIAKTAFNPFLSHDFLWSLEESGAATRKTGWLAQHLVLDGGDGQAGGDHALLPEVALQGEYVFDHGWADAFERAGGRYYPKLQAAVPFTPVTGAALLVRRGPARRRAARCWPRPASTLTRQHRRLLRCTSPSCPRTNGELLGAAGFLQRTDQQFHFVNEGYRDFDDFLAALASRKRKAIRTERARRAGRRHRDRPADRQRHHRGGTGTPSSRFYMDTGVAQMGPALPQPPLLLADRRAHGRHASC